MASTHLLLGLALRDPLCEAMPLFPDPNGETVRTAAVVNTVESIAEQLGEPVLDVDGQRRFGGHCCSEPLEKQLLIGLGVGVVQVKTSE